MRLVIGGYAQGKLQYVLRKYDAEKCEVWDGSLPDDGQLRQKTVVVNHFHHWVKSSIACGRCPEKEILRFLEKYPDCVIICDQLGNGVVPMEAWEREYRERTGRILVELAARAERVERILCGIGQRIK